MRPQSHSQLPHCSSFCASSPLLFSSSSSVMDRSISALLFSLIFVGVASAALTPQEYWKTVLPNTAIPGAVRELLHPEVVLDEKATTVGVDQGGVGVSAPGKTHVGVGGGEVHVDTGKGKPGGTTVDVGHKGGVGVNVGGHPGKPPVVVTVPTYGKGFVYKYAATETQIHDDPDVTLFFLEKDMYAGAKMSLHFTRTQPKGAFLSRSAANSIPFSSAKLPDVLTRFALQPNSREAEAMKQTLQECEEPAAAGESRHCATSLESMVDFATASLGTRDVRAVSTEVGGAGTPKQQYTIAGPGVLELAGSKVVACHGEPYAYPVFYCHVTRTTKAYVVPLVGEDGTRVDAVAVCHADTSAWNPRHVAFHVLKVKPGTVPVCHFLPQDHVIWAPRY
uniref:Dehydration-responsive protein RD22 n=1 Tax=Anthurium amnicola TaxID=1678845 RepID=A0A1D1ZGU6_9ARAE